MLKIAVCDDEPSAVAVLVSKIKAYMNTRQTAYEVSSFLNGESLLSYLDKSSNHFDAIYLDVKMKHLNGIDTAKALRKTDDKTCIIFVTALKEYVFDAFDVNATNFLVKPIDDHKLFSTLDKIVMSLNASATQFLIISTLGEFKKIPLANIVYCEVLSHRIFIYERDCMYEYAGKIDELEKKLDEDFFRCHRSYIVNFRFIESYKDGFAHMPGSEKIPIATRRRQAFMQAFLRFQQKEVR